MSIATDRIDTNPAPFDKLSDVFSNADSNALFNFIGPDMVYYVLKGGLVLFLIAYVIVAIMLIKQASMMSNTIKAAGNKYISTICIVHLIAVIICLLYALFIV